MIKQLEKFSKQTSAEVQRDAGLKWENIHPVPVALQRHQLDRKQQSLYSMRLTQSKRAVVLREGDNLRFPALPKDHDSADAWIAQLAGLHANSRLALPAFGVVQIASAR